MEFGLMKLLLAGGAVAWLGWQVWPRGSQRGKDDAAQGGGDESTKDER